MKYYYQRLQTDHNFICQKFQNVPFFINIIPSFDFVTELSPRAS